MAKEDFCFTYYDGDAARDMTHMNRLERGAYSDLIISQRKFGRLTLRMIKKTLGNDFTSVWENLELILKKENDEYYIEWLENSVLTMKQHGKKQSVNGKKGGRPKKPKEKPIDENNITQKKPLEDGDDNYLKNKKGNGKILIVVEMLKVFKEYQPTYHYRELVDNPELLELASCISVELTGDQMRTEADKMAVLKRWGEIVKFTSGHSFYKNFTLKQHNTNFPGILLKIKNGDGQPNRKNNTGSARNGGDESREQSV